MSKLQILSDMSHLKNLLGLYQKLFPNTAHGYYTLNNFIQWLELNQNVDHVHVYVLENWKENGLFIVLDRYQLFINTISLDEDDVANALKSLDWSRQYKIFALPAVLFPVVTKTLDELNMNTRMTTLKIYQRDLSFITEGNIKTPDFLLLRPLSIPDANVINEAWYSHQNGSLQFLQSLITNNISVGLYTKHSDELIAWCTRCQCGFLGTLHVKEQYRGQGLATILIENFSQRIIERGEDIRTMINDKNLASQKVFTKLGFKYQEDVYIIYSDP